MSAAAAGGSGGFVVGASVVAALRTVLRQHRLDHINHHALARLGQRTDALQLILQFRRRSTFRAPGLMVFSK